MCRSLSGPCLCEGGVLGGMELGKGDSMRSSSSLFFSRWLYKTTYKVHRHLRRDRVLSEAAQVTEVLLNFPGVYLGAGVILEGCAEGLGPGQAL